MFVDPCVIVKFIKKNLTRYNNVSKFYFYVPDNIHQLHVQQPSTYEKLEDANGLLGS